MNSLYTPPLPSVQAIEAALATRTKLADMQSGSCLPHLTLIVTVWPYCFHNDLQRFGGASHVVAVKAENLWVASRVSRRRHLRPSLPLESSLRMWHSSG